MGVSALFQEALAFPLRRMGPLLVLLFGCLQGFFGYLGHQVPESLGVLAALMIIAISSLILLDIRVATLTTLGGDHLLAKPGGPWGKALLATLLLVLPIMALGIIGWLVLVEAMAPDLVLSEWIIDLLVIPINCYAIYAVAAVIGENHLRGLHPSRTWRVIREQPKLCLIVAGISIADLFLTVKPDTVLVIAMLISILSTYLWVVCSRLMGRMAMGYRAALPALP